MKVQDLISMAWKNLMSRKLRTALTLLGVVIGTTAIIVMMSLGFGIQKTNEDLMLSMGDVTLLDVSPGIDDRGNPTRITEATLKAFKKMPHVKAVTPQFSTQVTLHSGRYTNDFVSLVAMDAQAFSDFGWDLAEGQAFKEKSSDFVFGDQVAVNFYDPKKPPAYGFDEEGNFIEPEAPLNPLHAKINLATLDPSTMFGKEVSSTPQKTVPISVSGILEKSNDYSKSISIYTSISNYEKILKTLDMDLPDRRSYNQVKIMVDEPENVEAVQNQLKIEGYESYGLTNMLEEMDKGMLIFQAIFGGIGAISFVVAAIGIANTMIMSIYERTREIGVMKVIGASIKDIQKLFLVESGFIGFLGGAIGVFFSLIISFGMNGLTASYLASSGADLTDVSMKISIIPLWLILVAFAFSSLVGVLAGYFPAKQAMNLSALDAIRSE
ncbi:MAG: ABC transporter permease [Tissierellia bacterium]|nr:ABC transporter permease [Tissierellia bacterium]